MSAVFNIFEAIRASFKSWKIILIFYNPFEEDKLPT